MRPVPSARFISTTTAGLAALRSRSKEMVPVDPTKPSVAARAAVQVLARQRLLARSMAWKGSAPRRSPGQPRSRDRSAVAGCRTAGESPVRRELGSLRGVVVRVEGVEDWPPLRWRASWAESHPSAPSSGTAIPSRRAWMATLAASV